VEAKGLTFKEEFFVVTRSHAGRALCDRRGEYRKACEFSMTALGA
jgi:hypothetical protein